MAKRPKVGVVIQDDLFTLCKMMDNRGIIGIRALGRGTKNILKGGSVVVMANTFFI